MVSLFALTINLMTSFIVDFLVSLLVFQVTSHGRHCPSHARVCLTVTGSLSHLTSLVLFEESTTAVVVNARQSSFHQNILTDYEQLEPEICCLTGFRLKWF